MHVLHYRVQKAQVNKQDLRDQQVFELVAGLASE